MEMITRKIDDLGRIVLPMDYRKAMGLRESSDVSISFENGVIILRRSVEQCKICGSEKELNSSFGICRHCMERIKGA